MAKKPEAPSKEELEKERQEKLSFKAKLSNK